MAFERTQFLLKSQYQTHAYLRFWYKKKKRVRSFRTAYPNGLFITILLGKISTPNQHGNFENHKDNLRQCDNPPIAQFEEHIMNDSAIYNPKPTPMQSFMTLESLMKVIQGLNKYMSAKVQHITTQLEFQGVLKGDQQLQRKSFTHKRPYCWDPKIVLNQSTSASANFASTLMHCRKNLLKRLNIKVKYLNHVE